MVKEYRTEKDIIGPVKFPADAYFGIFTARASENFPISGILIHPELNRSLAIIKKAAAQSNKVLGLLSPTVANAIINACNKIIKGEYDDQFILDVFQAGAGTPWNMNMNEVITNIALEIMGKKKGEYSIIDPHDHVNRGQSTNDVIPTAMRLAALTLYNKLVPEIKELIKSLKKKANDFFNSIKAGRTHLQDAVPITLGQEFSAWAHDLEHRLAFLDYAVDQLKYLNIGGTAVGTGLNAHPKFSALTVTNLKKITKLPLQRTADKIEKTQFTSDFLDVSSALRTIASDLTKIANDIRLLSSGPMTGFREIELPKVEPGSSIMPAKFNPSMAEMLNMVCIQVIGNDTAIQQATEAGQLELNVMTPVLAHNLLQSLDILRNGIREFTNKCVKGIKANADVLQSYFEKSPSLGTVLNTVIGYDKTAELIKESLKSDKSVKALAIEKKLLTEKEADKLFDPKNLV